MKKVIKGVILSLILVVLVYVLGPKVDTPKFSTELPTINLSLSEIEQEILNDSIDNHTKPGNASQLIWANDSLKTKTKYALVYLHGFSASPEEGNPTHINFAQRYGMNFYAPRLHDHGLVQDTAMTHFTAEGWMKSAKKAIAVGQQLGDSVIVMACSTGATAALYAASGNSSIHSFIL